MSIRFTLVTSFDKNIPRFSTKNHQVFRETALSAINSPVKCMKKIQIITKSQLYKRKTKTEAENPIKTSHVHIYFSL